MKGIIYVGAPEACQNCSFFRTILNNPLLIKYSDGRVEEVKGACMCALDYDHRLKPLDNGKVMEQISKNLSFMNTVQTTGRIYDGRPEWCQINIVDESEYNGGEINVKENGWQASDS